MKLTIMLILVAILQSSAKSTAQTVTYSGKPVSLQQMFTLIREQTNFRVFCREEDMAGVALVDVVLNNTPLQTALTKILAGRQLEFDIQGHTIFINKKEGVPLADIRGIVLDESLLPIPGVTVLAIKSKKATITNEKGEFVFNHLVDSDTLVFRSLNFQPLSMPADPTSYMRVKLKQQITKLVGVTVINTGYQILDKERATGSFGKPDMEVFAKRTGTMDIIGRLEGQIPGMQVATGMNSGIISPVNGTVTQKALIRGTGTVRGSTTPLYVVNGVIVADFSNINPDDVEDITVLKDAAAAAIWGARSANGVIIVNTKSGSRNQRLSVSYSGFLNYSGKPDFNYSNRLNSKQFIEVAKETFDPVNNPYSTQQFIAPHDQILYNQYRGLISAGTANQELDSLASINNTSQIKDLFYRRAFTTSHTVSVSGGNNGYSFYGSLGYTDAQSNTPGATSNSYRLSLSQNLNVGKRVNINLNTSLVNAVSSGKSPVSVGTSFLPYQLFRDAAGNNLNMNYMNGYTDSLSRNYAARSGISLDYNPLNEMNYGNNTSNSLSVNVTANVGVKLWKGLNFTGTYGYQKSPDMTAAYQDHQALAQRKIALSLTQETPTLTHFYPLTGGLYTTGDNDQRNWTVRNQLLYDADIRHGHDHIRLQGGQEVQQGQTFKSSSTVVGYDKALATYSILDLKTLQNGIYPTITGFGSFPYTPFSTNTTITRFISYFALASYSINDKYSLDASWRQDYSNVFASVIATQNKPIWSFGAKWRLTKENFMQPLTWLNDLSLRATYGITGNSPALNAASEFDILSPVTSSTTYYPVLAGDGLEVSGVANKSVAWENTGNLNIGIDYAVLNRKLSGSIDMYDRVTTDMIGTVPLNPLTGYASITGNIGKMVNKGIEVSIHSENIRTKDFVWNSSLVLGYNKNELVSYSNPSASVINNISYRFIGTPIAGYAMNPVWAYQFKGLDNMGDPQIQLSNKAITKQPNAATVADLKYMGTSQPLCSGGLSNSFGYKGFSLSLNMIYNMGNLMRRDVNGFYAGKLAANGSFSGLNIANYFLDRWQKPGDEAHTNIPSYVSSTTLSAQRRNVSYYTSGDINVVSASYIKLRDVSFSYNLPVTALRRLNVQRASVFVQTNNFIVWTANKDHLDPELPLPSGGYPVAKHNYSLGFNLTL